MLAKKFRLSHYDFLLAKKGGKQFRSEDFSATVAANTLDHPRFAVVTPAKLSKRAVVRNKLRRQIYDALGTKKLKSGDYLIFPRSSMLNLTNAQVNLRLDSLLSKIPGVS
jgi:ribonuclease P protein component